MVCTRGIYGHAMAHVVSHHPVIVETCGSIQVSLCRVCHGRSGTGRVLSSNSSVFSCQYHSMPIHSTMTSTTQSQQLIVSLNNKHKSEDVGNNDMAYKMVTVICNEDCI
jgi:hypothetical protein